MVSVNVYKETCFVLHSSGDLQKIELQFTKKLDTKAEGVGSNSFQFEGVSKCIQEQGGWYSVGRLSPSPILTSPRAIG